MKLLLDQMLPPILAEVFRDIFPGSAHVRQLGLASAGDVQVWDYAKKNGFTIVSKDSDFLHQLLSQGAPPKLVWVRLKNCSAAEVSRSLLKASDAIAALETSDVLILEIAPLGQ